MRALVYDLGLACLFSHELDAMTHTEWRLLPVLRGLPDPEAATWFVALHVPLFFGLLWVSHAPQERLRRTARLAIAGFLVVHAAMHFLQTSEAARAFHDGLSAALIAAAGVLGAGCLLLEWRAGRRAVSGR